MVEGLNAALAKLSVAEAKVSLFRGEDLVEIAYGSEKPEEEIANATRYDTHRDMAIEEILRVAKLEFRDIRNKSYEVGLMLAREVHRVKTVYEMMDDLTRKHPKANQLWLTSLSLNKDGSERPHSQRSHSIATEILSEEFRLGHGLQESKDEGVVKLSQPYQIFLNDLKEINESISPSRFLYFRPFVRDLANKKDVTRGRLINDIIHSSYPFSGELHIESWCEEIRGAD